MLTEKKIRDEVDCYTKILNLFLEVGDKPELKELWKNKTFITLMNRMKKNENKELIKNAMILIISLFDDIPPDLFSNIGSNLKSLSEEERKEAILKMKQVIEGN